MQYYTRQQVTGGPKFSSHTLIGNWNEDFARTDDMIRDVLHRQMTGTLKLDSYATKLQRSLGDIDLQPKVADGLVRLGELVMLLHVSSRSAVSTSVDQVNRPHCVTAATGDLATPCGRSTFYLEKYVAAKPSAYEPMFEGDVLRYGQKVRLVVNPMTAGEEPEPSGGSNPLYVFSRPISSDYAAKRSKHQYVGLTSVRSYDSVFQVLAVDPTQRGISEGLEVMSGAPFVLMHCQTNQALCVEQDVGTLTTDYGQEYEISCYTTTQLKTRTVTVEPNVFVAINGYTAPPAEEPAPAAE